MFCLGKKAPWLLSHYFLREKYPRGDNEEIKVAFSFTEGIGTVFITDEKEGVIVEGVQLVFPSMPLVRKTVLQFLHATSSLENREMTDTYSIFPTLLTVPQILLYERKITSKLY